jgi:hypothetical protein
MVLSELRVPIWRFGIGGFEVRETAYWVRPILLHVEIVSSSLEKLCIREENHLLPLPTISPFFERLGESCESYLRTDILHSRIEFILLKYSFVLNPEYALLAIMRKDALLFDTR